jgi:hypothetical protein
MRPSELELYIRTSHCYRAPRGRAPLTQNPKRLRAATMRLAVTTRRRREVGRRVSEVRSNVNVNVNSIIT